jgi:small subunit ribosomal protein S17
MTDDEKQNVDEGQESQDETPQDAGPVAQEDTSSSRDDAAGEESSSAPPASEASDADEAQDDASADEPADAPAPEEEGSAAEAAAAEENPEDDLPWKEKQRLERSRRPHDAGPQLSPDERAAKRAEARAAKAKLRRKQRAALKAEGAASASGTPRAERENNAAKVRQGIVVSDKGEKSITVRIDIVRRHPTYEKVVRRSRTLHAHDERNEAGEGDTVRLVETRPLSKTKRWRLVEVLEKAK